MVEEPNNGTSIKKLLPLNPDLTTNHGTLRTQEKLLTCKSGAPTQDGGRSSNTEEKTSSTSRTRRLSMYMEEKILKDKKLSSGEDTTNLTRDGELSTDLEKKEHLDTTETLVSTSIELSTSDPECQ
jgi:hypothetical protein